MQLTDGETIDVSGTVGGRQVIEYGDGLQDPYFAGRTGSREGHHRVAGRFRIQEPENCRLGQAPSEFKHGLARNPELFGRSAPG